jgi:kynurenine 3-monooxygenase
MQKKRVIIVGAGLTGPVLAIYLARLGWEVAIYERGDDPRSATMEHGKSINITLAERGLVALAGIGLRSQIQAASVAVYGRVIHHRDGRLERQAYGNYQEALWSISRFKLSQILTQAVADEPGVTLHFGYRLTALDISAKGSVARFHARATNSEIAVAPRPLSGPMAPTRRCASSCSGVHASSFRNITPRMPTRN